MATGMSVGPNAVSIPSRRQTRSLRSACASSAYETRFTKSWTIVSHCVAVIAGPRVHVDDRQLPLVRLGERHCGARDRDRFGQHIVCTPEAHEGLFGTPRCEPRIFRAA